MSEAIWTTWYDLDDADRHAMLDWTHAGYLPWLKQQQGIAWVAHYRNVGTGPTLATYHDIAGHAAVDEGLGTGSQYVVMAGAASSYAFYKPNIHEAALPDGFGTQLAKRRGVRQAVLAEEMRVSGPAAGVGLPGGVPAPAIQFGTYRIRNVEEEFDLALWYAQQRMPVMARMPGAVQTRKFLCSVGWAKHAILYEFESLEARTREFEVPHESKVTDPEHWTGRIVRTTLHTPGSPVVGERIWPPV